MKNKSGTGMIAVIVAFLVLGIFRMIGLGWLEAFVGLIIVGGISVFVIWVFNRYKRSN